MPSRGTPTAGRTSPDRVDIVAAGRRQSVVNIVRGRIAVSGGKRHLGAADVDMTIITGLSAQHKARPVSNGGNRIILQTCVCRSCMTIKVHTIETDNTYHIAQGTNFFIDSVSSEGNQQPDLAFAEIRGEKLSPSSWIELGAQMNVVPMSSLGQSVTSVCCWPQRKG